MKKPWGFIGKVIIPKKHLQREFEPLLNKYGKAIIDTLVMTSPYTGTVELRHDSIKYKRTFLRFNFTDKGKIEGLGLGYPTFVYSKKGNYLPANNLTKEKAIDSLVKRRASFKPPYNFNGCLMVSEGGSVLYKNCYGQSDFTSNETLNDSSMFLLASCSKQFTAVAIMMLQEKGLLEFNHPVSKYLPEFPYPNITVEQLLCHTSGLPDYFTLLKKYWDKSKFATNRDVLLLLAEHSPKPAFAPNQYFSYSNTGYVMLSLIIQKVSGLTYDEYLAANIFNPLGMKHSLVYNRRLKGDSIENYAIGHVYSRDKQMYILPDSSANYNYVSYMDGITGDDGVSSTIMDLHLWNEALKNHKLLSSTLMQKATTPHILNDGNSSDYGYGIFLKQGKYIENLEYHTGGWPGYSTMIIRFTESDRSIIILTNNDYDHFAQLADEVAVVLLKK